MHSSIIAQIMQSVFGFIMNFEFPWDGFTFTLYDYFVVCCIIFVMAFFVWHILLFFVNKVSGGISEGLSDDWEYSPITNQWYTE